MSGNRHAGGDERDGSLLVAGGNGDALRSERFAVDAIDERAAIDGRERDGERGFGEAVDGKLGSAAEAV